MLDLLNFMFHSFWRFAGCLLLLALLLQGGANLSFLMWNRFWRHWNIRRHGYPPPHCDADGDFRNTDKSEN